MKLSGTISLDAGVHNADILQYYVGDAQSAFGQVRLFEKTRVRGATAGPGGFYAKWAANMPESIEPTGEDAIFGQITFDNGVLGHWVNNHAGHGEPVHQRRVFGTRGSITSPGDRNGRPVELHLDDVGAITDQRILDYAPSYRLEPAAATLFGGERIWHYNFDFPMTDRKLLALEYYELARCVRTGQQPEVTGAVALRDVALVYALFESDRAGRPVTIEEVETSAVDAYQREIDQHLGLLEPVGAGV
jgi:predicted dehydrogenase